MTHRTLGAALAAVIAATSSLACTVTATPEPVYATTEVDSAPINVDTYPHVMYGGHATYYYQNRWYYNDGQRWHYYRSEPQELQRQRPYVQRAAPARPEERREDDRREEDRREERR